MSRKGRTSADHLNPSPPWQVHGGLAPRSHAASLTTSGAVCNAVLSSQAAEHPEEGWGQTRLRVLGDVSPLSTSVCPEALFESLAAAQGIQRMLRERRRAVRVPEDSGAGGEGFEAAVEATAVAAMVAAPVTDGAVVGGRADGGGERTKVGELVDMLDVEEGQECAGEQRSGVNFLQAG